MKREGWSWPRTRRERKAVTVDREAATEEEGTKSKKAKVKQMERKTRGRQKKKAERQSHKMNPSKLSISGAGRIEQVREREADHETGVVYTKDS